MQSIEELANLAAQDNDQTQGPAGGDFEYTPPAEGRTVGRFVEYIELGPQKQKPYQGKPKPDADMAFLGFELLNPKRDLKEIDVEGGEKKLVADFIRIKLPVKTGDKARFKKLFDKMRYGRENIKHMAQMLGNAFILTISHNKSEDGKRVYVNLDGGGEWQVSAPVIVDPLEGTTKTLNVRDNIRPLRIFLWDRPTKETWDSLFIDGEREVEVDGVKTTQSKNWLQNLIVSGPAYAGSALDALLHNVADLDIKEEVKKPNAEAALQELDQQKTAASASDDDLAALGLT